MKRPVYALEKDEGGYEDEVSQRRRKASSSKAEQDEEHCSTLIGTLVSIMVEEKRSRNLP